MLYHRDIYLPRDILLEVYEYLGMKLTFSNHAFEAAKKDVYGEFVLPHYFNFLLSEVIEVEVSEEKDIIKVLVRQEYSYDHSLDISIAVALPILLIKTAWLNETEDTHASLCVEKYVPLPEPRNNTWLRIKEAVEEYPPNPKYGEDGGRDE